MLLDCLVVELDFGKFKEADLYFECYLDFVYSTEDYFVGCFDFVKLVEAGLYFNLGFENFIEGQSIYYYFIN